MPFGDVIDNLSVFFETLNTLEVFCIWEMMSNVKLFKWDNHKEILNTLVI